MEYKRKNVEQQAHSVQNCIQQPASSSSPLSDSKHSLQLQKQVNFIQNSPRSISQSKHLVNPSTSTTQKQAKPNKTGMPSDLKTGLENLSGMDLSNLRVHYNSPKPKQLNAHAYAQGSNIHLATGQEKHLPHEAWHTIQQKQGRVKPTLSDNGININDSPALEREADIMGAKALDKT